MSDERTACLFACEKSVFSYLTLITNDNGRGRFFALQDTSIFAPPNYRFCIN